MKKVVIFLLMSFLTIGKKVCSQETLNCDSIYNVNSLSVSGLIVNPETIPRLMTDICSVCSVKGKVKGKVVVQMIVDTLGMPTCPKIVFSNNKCLDSKALSCATKLRFAPAVKNGRKVWFVYYLPIVFDN